MHAQHRALMKTVGAYKDAWEKWNAGKRTQNPDHYVT
jgi:hypothetical protein